ncbi:hypothetical protein MMG00_09930 [Ignatzschineria rhizosphaerae]|uniref:Uncharacterized protein n=1 Tax=Ignatzschineria rhizosphaerae TaxID=2923279 RepID=A0ABY3X1G9_9GAMM|nr:hypothetical protein [Ignatzschineria rhizosphaerae]UNM95539.1 hypothetical protein MMG00_09930 [Ignatzschineria rhizosphaerae]
MLIDIALIMLFIGCFLLGMYTSRKLMYSYYPKYELIINGVKAHKKITQKKYDQIIKRAKENPVKDNNDWKPLD